MQTTPLVACSSNGSVPSLKDKLDNALNEARILILGAQVLIGATYRSFFERDFDRLPDHAQTLCLLGLGLMLLGLALLISPVSYDHLVAQHDRRDRLLRFVNTIISVGLMPFAFSLAILAFVSAEKMGGFHMGLGFGVGGLIVCLFFWYGLELVHRSKKQRRLHIADLFFPAHGQMNQEQEQSALTQKIKEVLIEARMVLPGAQALLGFQFATMLMEGFDQLPPFARYVHFASFITIAICTVLLMTPAAYHRIVERGEDSEEFHTFAARCVLAAMVWLAIGVSADFYVVCRKVTESEPVALASSLALLAFFLGLWFGYTTWKRRQDLSSAMD